MNDCKFGGYLVRDPELKTLQGGARVVNLVLALNEVFKNRAGETVKETTFVDCEAWDTGADMIATHFRKGDGIYLHCAARNERWESPDGKKRSRTKFRVKHFEFPVRGPRRDEPDDDGDEPAPRPVAPKKPPARAQAVAARTQDDDADEDETCPF